MRRERREREERERERERSYLERKGNANKSGSKSVIIACLDWQCIAPS